MSGFNFDHAKIAFDAIDALESERTPEAVLASMSSTLKKFGYSSFLITDMPEAIGNAQPRILISGWPSGWLDLYVRENFYVHDPIVARCLRSVDPFEWKDVKLPSEKKSRSLAVMNAARDFGLNEGFVVPIYRNAPSMAAVTMAGPERDIDPTARRALHLISLYAHAKATSLFDDQANDDGQSLTPGEREVIRWTALGKSAWEISIILGIAEPTVIWRLKRAGEKMRAVNKMQTVVTAIRRRQISI